MSKYRLAENAVVVGARLNDDLNIGGQLVRRLNEDRKRVAAIFTTTSVYIREGSGYIEEPYDPNDPTQFPYFLAKIPKPDAGFICISTKDRGESALGYGLTLRGNNARVVTAEKGMAAWQFEHIADDIDNYDLGAAVGGGNMFLYTLSRRHLRDKDIKIIAVFNATNNDIMTKVGNGISIQQAAWYASRVGIAEPLKPGQRPNPASILEGERLDTLMKVCVFYNFVLASNAYLRPIDFGTYDELSSRDLAKLTSLNDRRRQFVMISNNPDGIVEDEDLIGRVSTSIGGYQIVVGFPSIAPGTVFDKFAPNDIDNGVLLTENGHTYSYWGPGAGSATIDALWNGMLEQLKR